jgi:hypothetical protein
VAVDPGVKIWLVEAPTLVEANFSQSVADDFLFEAVAGEATVGGGLIEGENALAAAPLPRASLSCSATALAKADRLMKSDVLVCIIDLASASSS